MIILQGLMPTPPDQRKCVEKFICNNKCSS